MTLYARNNSHSPVFVMTADYKRNHDIPDPVFEEGEFVMLKKSAGHGLEQRYGKDSVIVMKDVYFNIEHGDWYYLDGWVASNFIPHKSKLEVKVNKFKVGDIVVHVTESVPRNYEVASVLTDDITVVGHAGTFPAKYFKLVKHATEHAIPGFAFFGAPGAIEYIHSYRQHGNLNIVNLADLEKPYRPDITPQVTAKDWEEA